MNEQQIRALVAADAATWALFGGLIHFLEQQGVIDRTALTGYLRSMIASWERQASSEQAEAMQILRSKLRTLEQDVAKPVVFQ